MYRHGISLSCPIVIFALTLLPSKASPSHERIVLCIANTDQSIRCIHIDENKILSRKHILGIYQVYPWHIQGKGIYQVYTRYIPWKNFLGVSDGMLPCCWIRCCNSALPIALYWRLQHLITLMQAQAYFNQPRPALPPIWLPPLPLLAGGVGSAGFSGGAADSVAGAGGGAGTAAVASAGARRRWRWRCQRVVAGPQVGRARKQSGWRTCRTSACPLGVPQRRISWGYCLTISISVFIKSFIDTYTLCRNSLRLNHFHWWWRRQEARELVQLRRLQTHLNGRLGPGRGFKVRTLISFSNFS